MSVRHLGCGRADGPEPLGLDGMVEADDLRALIEGNDPASGLPLLVGLRQRTVKAFDLTFSAPKSVSLLWALGSEPVADVVMGAHREAVAAALGFLEERAALARVQVDGLRRHVPTAGWAVAGFVHRTSRAGDPQVHTHCLVPNVVRREDGRCVAIAARPMFVWARAAGSVYQAELQRLLSLRLGVEWQPDRSNTREIAGFDRETLRTFSKRTVEIEAELEANGRQLRVPAFCGCAPTTKPPWRPARPKSTLPPRRCCSLGGRPKPPRSALPSGHSWSSRCAGVTPNSVPSSSARSPGVSSTRTPGCVLMTPGSPNTTSSNTSPVWPLVGCPPSRSLDSHSSSSSRILSFALLRRRPRGGNQHAGRPSAHRRLEDDALRVLDRLAARPGASIATATIAARLRAAGFLGADQCQAVSTLCGPGGSVRAVLAPAGYGKTAMAHVAADCATADGRPVLAVATTAKAVAELRSAGLSARTIAQFRIDLTSGALPTGTVVILDEISQTSTRDGHTVLAAVDTCPGAQLWVLGDPRQAPAVKAGGIAAEIDTRATTGSIPAAQLTVNRRQVDPDDCRALNLLRGGDPVASQRLRREHGWEHTGQNPEDTLREMADAVTADIVRYGPETSVALALSHAQAEDLADRIRRRLTSAGQLTGPTITGPGWTTDRRYQAGDRVLLHTRHGDRHSPLVNGTVGTITAVDAQGLLFRPDQGMPVPLPAAFVQGVRADGAPNLSHAWARTVDGSQGGTWDHIHLLGTAALDAYRGYTAQSRSRQPTHTWNTAMLPTLDFGGRLAHGPDPDRDVAVALARIPDTSMAAVDDPWTLDRHLRHLIAAHRAVLDGQPPDRHRQLDEADRHLATARENLAAANNALAATQHALDGIGPLAALTRRGRAQRSDLEEDLVARQARGVDAAGSVATAEVRVARLTGEQAAHDRHEQEHGWRRGAIDDAWERLDQHWTDVALVCVRADQTLAYGVEPLRIGRQHLTSQLVAIEAALPQDLSYDRDIARTQARAATRARAAAEDHVAAAEAELDEQMARRWPRRDKIAVGRCTNQLHAAHQQLLGARHTESTARARFDDLDQHEQDRAAALAATAGDRFELTTAIDQLDSALDRTRTERVLQLVDQPTQLHLDVLGPIPPGAAGRAVWCYQATRLEHHLDHDTGNDGAWHRLVDDLSETPTLARLADRHIRLDREPVHPSHWRQITDHAAALNASTIEQTRHIPQRDLGIGLEL